MQDEVDVLVAVLQDYGWQMQAGGRPQLQAVRWFKLFNRLSRGHGGKLVPTPVGSWEQALSNLLSSATVRALESTLHNCHEACIDVWQDLWSQCCEGKWVPSRSVLPLLCHGCGVMALVWVHQWASVPLCELFNERARRGWPEARWALRQSGRLSSSGWHTWRDLQDVLVEGMRSPHLPTVGLPLLL